MKKLMGRNVVTSSRRNWYDSFPFDRMSQNKKSKLFLRPNSLVLHSIFVEAFITIDP